MKGMKKITEKYVICSSYTGFGMFYIINFRKIIRVQLLWIIIEFKFS